MLVGYSSTTPYFITLSRGNDTRRLFAIDSKPELLLHEVTRSCVMHA